MLMSPEDFTDAIATKLRPHASSDVLGVHFSAGDGGGGADVSFSIYINRKSYLGGNRGEDAYELIDLALHIPGRPEPVLTARGWVDEGTAEEAMEDASRRMRDQITQAFELCGVLRGAGVDEAAAPWKGPPGTGTRYTPGD